MLFEGGDFVKGSFAALALGAFLYVFAATGVGLCGLCPSSGTQVAAIIATAVLVTVPAINFSGYLYPRGATIEGAGRFIGLGFPFHSGSRTSASASSPRGDLSPISTSNSWCCSRSGQDF